MPEPPARSPGRRTAEAAAAEAIVFGERIARSGAGPDAGVELSARERQILALASCGLSNADVADALDLSIETVKSHMRRVLGKLGARNRCHAVALGYEHGLLKPGAMPAGARPAGAAPGDSEE